MTKKHDEAVISLADANPKEKKGPAPKQKPSLRRDEAPGDTFAVVVEGDDGPEHLALTMNKCANVIGHEIDNIEAVLSLVDTELLGDGAHVIAVSVSRIRSHLAELRANAFGMGVRRIA